jgi:hypothetical protein
MDSTNLKDGDEASLRCEDDISGGVGINGRGAEGGRGVKAALEASVTEIPGWGPFRMGEAGAISG